MDVYTIRNMRRPNPISVITYTDISLAAMIELQDQMTNVDMIVGHLQMLEKDKGEPTGMKFHACLAAEFPSGITRCMMTGSRITTPWMIIPHPRSALETRLVGSAMSDEWLDSPANGLLLSPWVGRLFSQHYITFDRDGHVIVSDSAKDDIESKVDDFDIMPNLHPNGTSADGAFYAARKMMLMIHNSIFFTLHPSAYKHNGDLFVPFRVDDIKDAPLIDIMLGACYMRGGI